MGRIPCKHCYTHIHNIYIYIYCKYYISPTPIISPTRNKRKKKKGTHDDGFGNVSAQLDDIYRSTELSNQPIRTARLWDSRLHLSPQLYDVSPQILKDGMLLPADMEMVFYPRANADATYVTICHSDVVRLDTSPWRSLSSSDRHQCSTTSLE